MVITSKNNNKYKEIKKLLASSRARSKAGLFVVEGERICAEIPKELPATLCVSESYAALHGVGNFSLVFSDEVFKSLSDTVNPQGILAVVKQPLYSLGEILDKGAKEALYLILDDIRDPGNLGTIIRTAEAAGADGVIMSPGCADIFNPKVIRSTMGSIFRVPFVCTELSFAIADMKEKKISIYAACLDGEVYYNEEKYSGKNAFIIGNEASGISEKIASLADKKIKIPMAGQAESLNAAVSAAIIMYGYKKWT